MKRTTEAQLGGQVLSFEDDAYEKVLAYLKTAEKTLTHDEDKQEILADLELALVERLRGIKRTTEAFTLEQVLPVLEAMGTVEPADSDETETTVPKSEKKSWKDYFQGLPHKDSKNRVIEGVCAGLASYFGIEALWVRIAATVHRTDSISGAGRGESATCKRLYNAAQTS